jgi:O-antigen/teichoic acid export membrane protein
MSDAGARTGGRLLARNSALNVVGLLLPMATALVTVPILMRGLGVERFGILTVGWVVLGYFGLFDFGLGRAMTKVVAEKLGAGRQEEVPSLAWTSLVLMFLFGAAGGITLAALAPWLVGSAFKISPEYRLEALHTLYLLAFSLPWVISTTGLSGILEANQSFGVVSSLRTATGLFSYLSPLLVLPFSEQLVPVIALLVVGRMLGWGAYLAACLRTLPFLRRRPPLEWERAKSLMQLGGWMTVSNVVSPLMTYFDRFLIGGLISMAAVAHYVTPYEIVIKLLLIPNGLLGVLFPAFAATFPHNRLRTAQLLDRGVRVIFLLMFPVVLVLITFAREGMTLWLGQDFARHSAGVLQWLALGVFINCLAQAPFALIQGIGRPDITGKLHLLEFPLYAAAIWYLSQRFGVEGVAMAWVLRVVVDTAILYFVAGRFLPDGEPLFWGTFRLAAPAVVVFGLGAVQHDLGDRALFSLVALVVFGLVAWFWILDPTERALLQRRTVLDA